MISIIRLIQIYKVAFKEFEIVIKRKGSPFSGNPLSVEADIELSNFLADLQDLELFMKRFQNP